MTSLYDVHADDDMCSICLYDIMAAHPTQVLTVHACRGEVMLKQLNFLVNGALCETTFYNTAQ